MIQKVAFYIQKYKLLTQCHEKVVVGLSGGVDSSVLLYVLHTLGYFCCAVHCNFHLREKESDRDELQAKRLASSMDIDFFKKDFDTFYFSKKKGISVEMATRYLRYNWFEQIRESQNAQAIAVAHHKDDNIETLLLNLIRGTGIRGLVGMSYKNGKIIRPFLNVDKQEIVKFANKHQIVYIIDSSNFVNKYKRNEIRLTLIPYLKTLNLSIKHNLICTITHLKEIEKIYRYHIEQVKNKVFDRDSRVIIISELRKLPSPESVLFEILKDYKFNRTTIMDVVRGISGLSGKEYHSSEYVLIKDRGRFLLIPKNIRLKISSKTVYKINKSEKKITIPLLITIDYKKINNDFQIIHSSDIAYLDEDKLRFPLYLRQWQNGDRFIPLGMCQFQKLSDYFSNNKFSKLDKEKMWVLCSETDIIWIVGERIDNRYKVSSMTKSVMILKT